MRLRTKVLIAAAAVLLPAGGFALYWFQPWLLWANDTVHDALPSVVTASPASGTAGTTGRVAAPHDVVLARGTFISHEHDTSGTATIVQLASGKRVLAIAKLDTSEGPAVHVWLTDQNVTKGGWHVFDDGRHVDLGDLKGNHGSLVYKIPDKVDLSTVKSVTIWCERFDVSFGAAQLAPVS